MEQQKKRFHGKAIYQPGGAAREYSPWACNLYNGCTNRCDYCYNRHSQAAKLHGADVVTLKASLRDARLAKIYFKRELNSHIEEIRKAGGIFFSFVSDPMLPETIDLTTDCVVYAAQQGVNVQILTKQAAWVTSNNSILHKLHPYRDRIAVGFTITGMDEQEHGQSSNFDRVEAMHRLHGKFLTFASVEPVIDIDKAVRMVSYAEISCDLFKVGLATKIGRTFTRQEVENLFYSIHDNIGNTPIYWKDTVRNIIPDLIGTRGNSVGADYDIFNE